MASSCSGTTKIGQYDLGKAICYAICNDQFHLNFQPKYFMVSGALQGAEVLLRWKHPEWGWISPAYFVPFAERYGLASELFEWVLLNVCRQVAEWESCGLHVPGVSVNMSPSYLEEKSCVKNIMSCMSSFDINPGALEIVITETAVFSRSSSQIMALRELRANGVGVALDDFGVGYSSISHLMDVPLSTIKIDKCFIDRIEDEKGGRLVESIVRLGHEMGLDVVAEGVEQIAQVTLLRKSACDIVQGYFFSRPVSAVDFESVLRLEAVDSAINRLPEGGILLMSLQE